MKTDDLVNMLASGVAPVRSGVAARRFGVAIGCAALGSTLLMMVWLGVRDDLVQAAGLPMFWVKLVFPVALAAAALTATSRLARPGASLARLSIALAAPVIALWTLAAVALATADPAERMEMILGETWAQCPLNILLLAGPALLAILWAMRGLAPTRLSLAGAAAGLLAGTIGSLSYALHCPEMAAPFLAVWYVAGIVAAALFGALVGPRALRW